MPEANLLFNYHKGVKLIHFLHNEFVFPNITQSQVSMCCIIPKIRSIYFSIQDTLQTWSNQNTVIHKNCDLLYAQRMTNTSSVTSLSKHSKMNFFP